MSIFDALVAGALPITPKFIVGKVARRYIAGETLEEALAAVASLNERGIECTMDVLGEFITEMAEARETAAQYARVQEAIHERGVRSTVSVKLTAFGLLLDADECGRMVRGLAETAQGHGSFLRIDMEDSSCTDRTLDLVHRLYDDGLPVGTVLQSYMRRTEEDARVLGEKGISVRLCKGIYREPPEVAFQDREGVRENYRRALGVLLDGKGEVGIATHDEVLVSDALAVLAEREVPPERVEFQMLLGVREWLRDEILAKGHRMRVYVPFGASWYAYSVRRLRENPAIAGHVFRALIGMK